MDDENPPVRRLTLKAKDVVPTDKVAQAGDGTAISVRLMHLENRLAEEKRAGAQPDGAEPLRGSTPRPKPIAFTPKAKAFEEPVAETPSGQEIDVHAMLRANHAAAGEADVLIAMPPPRRSRRRRDLMVVLGLAVGAAAVLDVVFRNDVQIIAIGSFAIAFLTVVTAWIMFGVMDKY